MTEADLHKKLLRITKALWPVGAVMLHRVENTAAMGTFDTFFGTPAGSGWIELKITGPNAKPQMRPGQPAFGLVCKRAGVPAHVLCSSHKGELKLLNGWTTGDDWRDHLVMRADLGDKEAVRGVLLRCVT